MKIILSRKGFDSQYGGFPSPILPDGRMISLPIPSSEDSTYYKDLKLDNKTYYDLMRELGININSKATCHLDPDIYNEVLIRNKNWKPIFGQIGAAQSHLNNQNVGKGDLFLFFGSFRKTKSENGKLIFDLNHPEIHAIFGYLQVEDIIKPNSNKILDWMKYHPHILLEKRRIKSNNSIYIARNKLSWSNKFPGAGFLKFNENLVLTKKGLSKSKWNLNSEIFKNIKISYHFNPWKENYFQSASKGQEFVIQDNKKVEEWAKNLIK